MSKAKLIVIEGSDGSGKETQSKKLIEYFESNDLKVAMFSFPMYNTPTGKIVGGPYLGKTDICESYFNESSANVDAYVSSLYFAADRKYNYDNLIKNEMSKNDIIVLDRYTTSNMGHQAGKAKTKYDREKIVNFIETLEFDLLDLPRPDKVIFLHMPYEATCDLRKGRESTDGNEKSITHQKNSEKEYLILAKEKQWDIINCIKTKKYNNISDIKSIDEISKEVINICKRDLL